MEMQPDTDPFQRHDRVCLWIEDYNHSCTTVNEVGLALLANLPHKLWQVSFLPTWPLFIIMVADKGTVKYYITYNYDTDRQRRLILYMVDDSNLDLYVEDVKRYPDLLLHNDVPFLETPIWNLYKLQQHVKTVHAIGILGQEPQSTEHVQARIRDLVEKIIPR
jgi:hypothetical protein